MPSETEPLAAGPDSDSINAAEIQKIIDNAASWQSGETEAAATAELLRQSQAHSDRNEGWMTLLSRALSGILDIIILVLCTGALIIAADLVSGIRRPDLVSLFNYSMLLLLLYFIYAVFFLVILNQTIGMMIANLQLIAGTGESRPQTLLILARCCCYLVSLLCLGIGLLWALFDREHQCLHDRLTNTRIVRV